MILDRRTKDDAALPGPNADAGSEELIARRSLITVEARAQRLGQSPVTVWLTGLPRSGKTTSAYGVERALFEQGMQVHVLDGENLRLGMSDNLGFGALERSEHIRRAAHIAKLCNDLGMITIVALVSPFASDRCAARDLIGAERFLQVHVSAPLAVCEARDDSALYARARRDEIPHVTGISAPYEAPESPDLVLLTEEIEVDESISCVVALLRERGFAVKR